eukprot:6206217-Pleurochrysis_carterae.AAC.1
MEMRIRAARSDEKPRAHSATSRNAIALGAGPRACMRACVCVRTRSRASALRAIVRVDTWVRASTRV